MPNPDLSRKFSWCVCWLSSTIATSFCTRFTLMFAHSFCWILIEASMMATKTYPKWSSPAQGSFSCLPCSFCGLLLLVLIEKGPFHQWALFLCGLWNSHYLSASSKVLIISYLSQTCDHYIKSGSTWRGLR